MSSRTGTKTRCQNCIPASTIRSEPVKEEMIAVSTRYRPVEETFLHQKKVGAWALTGLFDAHCSQWDSILSKQVTSSRSEDC